MNSFTASYPDSMVSTRAQPRQQYQISYLRRVLQPQPGNPNTETLDKSNSGKFGWTVIEDVPVPFIYRGDEPYTSTRILETYVFKKYESILHPSIFSCVSIMCWLMHSAEVRLFNEINSFHCDNLYGPLFNCSETLVKLQDAIELSTFLTLCTNKLKQVEDSSTNRCGFYKLNKEAVVPYIMVNKEAYLPIFYFEGEVENINHKSIQISGWDVCYLKFCCKIQQIKESLYNKPVHEVMKLSEIMKHFPAPQTYDHHWPNNITAEFLLPQRY